jgi:hypothetical protein
MATNLQPSPSEGPGIAEIVLIIMVILSLAGIGLTHYSPEDAFIYWMGMIFLFGILAIIAGWDHAKRYGPTPADGTRFRKLWAIQSLHWLGSLVAVLCVFTLMQTGRIDGQTTGLMVLILLALATFLDGIRIGWRFCIAGMYLAAAAVITNYVQAFLPTLFLLAAAIIGVTIYLDKKLAQR